MTAPLSRVNTPSGPNRSSWVRHPDTSSLIHSILSSAFSALLNFFDSSAFGLSLFCSVSMGVSFHVAHFTPYTKFLTPPGAAASPLNPDPLRRSLHRFRRWQPLTGL